MAPPASTGSPYTTYEALYLPVYAALSISTSSGPATPTPELDIYHRLTGTYLTGPWFYDALHPNDYGYQDIANAATSLLLGGIF